ncbi:type VI secretion system protein TssL, long form [Psychrobacter sp. HII-4]|uniref:type VI secretion system protein TssL, long form n=1 Tax=Psychrobacter sp. HII-4 TaxID=1569264 RepID=UPI00191A2DA4|nr:type VI secretion system protein TssL, long form [Psychrobacter sp. HII-4]
MKSDSRSNLQFSDIYNPIISAAKPVFVLSNAMRNSTTQLSTEKVLFRFTKMIEDFEAEAEQEGAPYEMVKAAQYCLCTFVDESAVRSGWSDEEWSQRSLLVSFFDETWGGERFFEILEKAKLDVDKNLYLIEFIYLCLQFGYKGKYQIANNGETILEQEKSKLIELIKSKRPETFSLLFHESISSKQDEEVKRRWHIPLWVIGVLASLIVAFFYILLRFFLGSTMDDTSAKINNLSLPKNAQYTVVGRDTTQTKPLTPALQSEISRDLVEVNDFADRSVITILGDGLFESGSENVQNQFFPVLATIGQALQGINGQVVVTGYTDDTPIQSITFPSNWHLSQARADAVKDILTDYIENKNRIRSEGRGSTNPVVANDTAENKAKNRRVEITVYSLGNNLPVEP